MAEALGQGRPHNLTVDGRHTYYVLAGNTPVLVHNCGNDQGVYIFQDKKAGLPYVGQAASFQDRLGKHARRGRRDPDGHVICIHVCGSQAKREAVEADVIELLGGKERLANEKNSPGLKRRFP
nr:GIY-YIG nuclease family protein [Salinispora pacifica]